MLKARGKHRKFCLDRIYFTLLKQRICCLCFRHPSGEVLVPRALSSRHARQSARLLPETPQVLCAERAQTQTTQSQEETVSTSCLEFKVKRSG